MDPVFAFFRIGSLIKILEKLPQCQEANLDRHGMRTPRQRLQDLFADKGPQTLHSVNMGVVIARREFDRSAQSLKNILELGRGRWGCGRLHRVFQPSRSRRHRSIGSGAAQRDRPRRAGGLRMGPAVLSFRRFVRQAKKHCYTTARISRGPHVSTEHFAHPEFGGDRAGPIRRLSRVVQTNLPPPLRTDFHALVLSRQGGA